MADRRCPKSRGVFDSDTRTRRAPLSCKHSRREMTALASPILA